jgi:RND family efflux transporter MFP subunit
MSSIPPTPKKNPAPSQTRPATTSRPQAAAPTTAPRKGGGYGYLILLAIVLLGLAGLLYFFGVVPRVAARTDLDREQKISNQRIVIYALARLAAPKVELPLPGTVEAFQQASIYARTNGYVKRWLVDIGDLVREGDLLAELDTPEVDQQLSQAKATAEEAKAAVEIAQTAADRWNAMVAAHAVSQEEADEKNATLSEAKATLNADQANVGQLAALENFKHIRAPFTGTITYRNIEVGNLVSAPTGSNSTATGSTELYRIAQTDPLRLYVDVPEANTRSIQPGVEADLHVAAYPDRIFHGEIDRSAGALDTTSRTLRTEIRVANPDGALLPGAFAEVRLELVDSAPAILIPANTLIVNSAGTQVALIENIDGQDKIHFLPVKVGRDFGTEVEILQDLKDGDRLVTNPAADLNEGAVVTAKPLPKPATPAPANPALKP